MHVTGDDHWHLRLLGGSLPLVESPAIVVVAMQFGHSVCSIEKHVAPSWQLGGRLSVRRRQDPDQQPPRVFGDICKGQVALTLRRLPAAACQELTKAPITTAIHRP
jgi:hypothetical protein